MCSPGFAARARASLTPPTTQGIATIRLLRQLEQRTGRRIHELFDLVAGTSTGGILAVALALKRLSLEECEDIYRRAAATPGPCTRRGGLHRSMRAAARSSAPAHCAGMRNRHFKPD
jgi:hypothetical protein